MNKKRNIFTRFLAVFMIFIISIISIAGASATNSFTVNNPLDPEWADGNDYVDYTFEVTNDETSTDDIGIVKIYFPESSWTWWFFDSSCQTNTIPGWSLSDEEEGSCTWRADTPTDRIAPGNTVNFMPNAKTDETTGNYFWYVTVDFVNDGTQTRDTICQIDNDNPVIGDPVVYSPNYYYNETTHTHWVGNEFDLRSQVSDADSGIDINSCEIKKDGTYYDADHENVPPEYCYEQGIEINNLVTKNYNFRVKDNVGNSASSGSLSVKGDTVAPTTTDNVPCCDKCGTCWESEDQTFTLTPTDGESGVAATYYCIANGGETCDPDPLVDGTEGITVAVTCGIGENCEKYIRYYSVDNVGNDESVQESCIVQIDKKDPWFENVLFIPASPSNDNTPELSFDVLDEASGIKLSTLTFEGTSVGTSCIGITNGYTCSFTLDPLTEGNNVLDFYVEDYVGNVGTDTANYVVDTTDPTTSDDELCIRGGWYIEDQEVILTADDGLEGSGVAATYYCVADWSSTCDPNPLVDGTEGITVAVTCGIGENCEKYIRYYSVDNVGNDESVRESCPILIDKEAPSILNLHVEYPAGQTQAKNGDDVIVTVQATDLNGINYVDLDATLIGGSATESMVNTGGDTYEVTITVTGTVGDVDQLVTATAYDVPGNSDSTDGTVEIDNTAPIIENIVFDPASPSNDPTPLLEFDITDSDSGVDESSLEVEVVGFYTYQYEQMSCNPITEGYHCSLLLDTLPEGDNVFNFQVEDYTENVGTNTDNYFVDSIGPVITAINVDPNPTSINPYVTAEATDELTNVEEARFYIDHEYGTEYSMQAADENFDELIELIYEQIDITNLDDGVHLVQVQAKDEAGNWGDLLGITFVVDRTTIIGQLCPVWAEAHIPWFLLESATGLEGDYSVENVLYSIDGQYNMVYYYNEGEWYSNMPNRGINDLTTMYHEEGSPYYWIEMLQCGILEIE